MLYPAELWAQGWVWWDPAPQRRAAQRETGRLSGLGPSVKKKFNRTDRILENPEGLKFGTTKSYTRQPW
jgi:hypothetical protein